MTPSTTTRSRPTTRNRPTTPNQETATMATATTTPTTGDLRDTLVAEITARLDQAIADADVKALSALRDELAAVRLRAAIERLTGIRTELAEARSAAEEPQAAVDAARKVWEGAQERAAELKLAALNASTGGDKMPYPEYRKRYQIPAAEADRDAAELRRPLRQAEATLDPHRRRIETLQRAGVEAERYVRAVVSGG